MVSPSKYFWTKLYFAYGIDKSGLFLHNISQLEIQSSQCGQERKENGLIFCLDTFKIQLASPILPTSSLSLLNYISFTCNNTSSQWNKSALKQNLKIPNRLFVHKLQPLRAELYNLKIVIRFIDLKQLANEQKMKCYLF